MSYLPPFDKVKVMVTVGSDRGKLTVSATYERLPRHGPRHAGGDRGR